MPHPVFLPLLAMVLHGFAAATAWAGALASLLFFARYKRSSVLIFGLFMFSFALLCGSFGIIAFYENAGIRESWVYRVAIFASFLMGSTFLPLQAALFGSPRSLVFNRISLTVAVVLFLLGASYSVNIYPAIIFALFMLLFYGVLGSTLLFSFLQRKSIPPATAGYLRYVGLVTALFFPLFILDALHKIPLIPDNTVPSLFILILSALSLIFAFRFFDEPSLISGDTLTNHCLHRFKLSVREQEIVETLLTGKSNREIAGIRFISEKTVENHLTSIYAKCSVRGRSQLAALLRAGQ
jgi:DNA-binding CsgD family transcriptional regulator